MKMESVSNHSYSLMCIPDSAHTHCLLLWLALFATLEAANRHRKASTLWEVSFRNYEPSPIGGDECGSHTCWSCCSAGFSANLSRTTSRYGWHPMKTKQSRQVPSRICLGLQRAAELLQRRLPREITWIIEKNHHQFALFQQCMVFWFSGVWFTFGLNLSTEPARV